MANETVYFHGYSRKEQDRLYYQARLWENEVYDGIDFSKSKKIIEIGCGVGAQTKILLERFPHLEIVCVDLSPLQLQRASEHLKKYIAKGQVRLLEMNAKDIHKIKESFDGAFFCWFLEHVPDALKVLKTLKKILKKGAPVYCTEVQNAGFFVNPYSPTILKYWHEFHDLHWYMGGKPFMGALLGNYFQKAGYSKIELSMRASFADMRSKKKLKKHLRDLQQHLLGAHADLKRVGRVTEKDFRNLKKEFKILLSSHQAVHQVDFVHLLAQK